MLYTNILLVTVMPTIEKLLSSDWKERLLGKSPMETNEVKGEHLI